jgi:hypothetical protein
MMIALLPLETIGSVAFFFTAKLSRNYFAHKYNLWNIVRDIMSDIYMPLIYWLLTNIYDRIFNIVVLVIQHY